MADHACAICGELALIYSGPQNTQLGKWFCAIHDPRKPSDPFAHIRAQLGPVDEDNANLCEGCTRDLLADADVLILLVPVLERIANYPFGGHTPPEMRKLASDALAALPEYLRTEERNHE